MTNEQRDRLTAAVTELNAAILDVRGTDGEATRIYPSTVLCAEGALAAVSVTTGCDHLGPVGTADF